MDFSSKGISWVGNMYQKLETVCVDMLQEMDDFMAQEPAKSVETQVQTGVNVQKFCNEVIEDIFAPSSVHSVQVPVTDLSVAYDTSIGSNQSVPDNDPVPHAELDMVSMEVETPVEDSSPGTMADVTQSEHHTAECDILSDKSVSSGSEEEKYHNVSDEAAFIDSRSGSLWSDSELASIVYHDSTPTPLSSTLSSKMTGTDTSSAIISVVASPLLKASDPEAGNGKSGNADMDNVSDVIDVISHVQEKFEDLFLGESYLDVQSNEIDNELSILSHNVAIRKSYKKKLQDALLSRLLPATKYRKVQILNSGLEYKDRQSSSPCSTFVEGFDVKKPPTQEFCESEWEFL